LAHGLPTNPLCFHQHSRLKHVTPCVFYDIPVLLWATESRSFVFIDIPASFIHFLKLLWFSFVELEDILSLALLSNGPAGRQPAPSGATRSKITDNSPFIIHNSQFPPIPAPPSCPTPRTILAYSLRFVKRGSTARPSAATKRILRVGVRCGRPSCRRSAVECGSSSYRLSRYSSGAIGV